MFSRCNRSFIIILITTIPLVHSRQFNVTDDDFSDLYQQAPSLVLKAHNSLRSKLHIPPLQLKSKLNALSKEWAEKLAKNRLFYHRPNNEYGENIYRENYQTGLHYPSMFVHAWYSEEKFFHRDMRFNELYRVSNFTQIIWRNTKFLGVAAVTNDDYKEVYLVCTYDPPGNIVDEYLNNIDLDRLIPELETNLHRPDRFSASVRSRINLSLMLLIIVPTSGMILR